MGDLNELVERLKAATGPDRFLEEDIAQELEEGWSWNDSIRSFHTPNGFQDRPPEYTASIDAALALVERKLPGSCVLVGDYKGLANPAMWGGKYQNAKGWCSLSPNDEAMSSHRAHAETPPLAILAALLAVLSLDSNKGDGV